MASHSVAEAKNHLSRLIDRALEGEEVVITRHGAPMVVLKAVVRAAGPVTDEELDWLDRHQVGGPIPDEDAGTAVSRMRDEDWR
ncbi:MAG TPA: type II toxin-antitoxin system Phd/YefM family antitoxin [Caulobacteraceae bacterium]|jgi:prevent-host-death family protein